ncbi:hypothetical protein [Jiulongibacter sediminis]|uniref:Uncharacterized protein n=1 Tax=Jiulongibacter sediminis TaxID=1605367 RepID=A0A0N8HA99_9BACT|nr:hypothetical protein [Jiulongibacter sediminis]KPM49580.1 hypothetical protein AFM12_02980 [Jiulongibacter sediminis]TBX26619.1 hypothetical protein TK44_02985 [Jiulongibacter sediminis]
MSSKRLAYLYLPSIALILCLIALAIDLYYNQPIKTTVIFLIPLMLLLIGIGIKNKVWKD